MKHRHRTAPTTVSVPQTLRSRGRRADSLPYKCVECAQLLSTPRPTPNPKSQACHVHLCMIPRQRHSVPPLPTCLPCLRAGEDHTTATHLAHHPPCPPSCHPSRLPSETTHLAPPTRPHDPLQCVGRRSPRPSSRRPWSRRPWSRRPRSRRPWSPFGCRLLRWRRSDHHLGVGVGAGGRRGSRVLALDPGVVPSHEHAVPAREHPRADGGRQVEDEAGGHHEHPEV